MLGSGRPESWQIALEVMRDELNTTKVTEERRLDPILFLEASEVFVGEVWLFELRLELAFEFDLLLDTFVKDLVDKSHDFGVTVRKFWQT